MYKSPHSSWLATNQLELANIQIELGQNVYEAEEEIILKIFQNGGGRGYQNVANLGPCASFPVNLIL